MSQAKQPISAKQPSKVEAMQPVRKQQAPELLPMWGQNPAVMQRVLNGPQSLNSAKITNLQRVIGNQVLGHLIRSIGNQNAETIQAAPSKTSGNNESEIDAKLDALLAQIVVKTPPVPAFEAITSTTAGEFSVGDLESEIKRLWTREQMSFTEAARHAAQANTVGDRGTRATQSQRLAPAANYTRRWALNLFAADYRGKEYDLPDVAALMHRGSPFQKSLSAEFDRVIPVRNPTGKQMSDRIFKAIHDLWLNLPEGQIGELVVSFSGHGGNGFISGIDWGELSPSELRSLAQLAKDFNVHIVYILDTCRAGLLVNFAQATAWRDLDKRVAQLPENQRSTAQGQSEHIRQLIKFSSEVNNNTIDVGNSAREYRGNQTQSHLVTLSNDLLLLLTVINAFDQQEGLQRKKFSTEGQANFSILLQLKQRIQSFINHRSLKGNQKAINKVLREVAVFLDVLNEVINDRIENLNKLEDKIQSR